MGKRDEVKRGNSLADLGKILGRPERTGPPAPAPAAGSQPQGAGRTAAAPVGQSPVFSCDVTRAERAGRASYNFVPLPESVHWEAQNPPRQDRFDGELLSGEIEFEMEAKTDFFIRGMRDLREYAADPEGKAHSAPFLVNGELRLPGSSLRGMVRNLVEILGRSPLDPVNDEQHFFRAVAAVANPSERSFEPQAVAYKSRVVSADQVKDSKKPRVLVGYLYGSRDEWKIRPAQQHFRHARQWFQLRDGRTWERRGDFYFLPEEPRNGPSKWARESRAGEPGAVKGWVVRSGPMQKKTHQWALMPEDEKGAEVTIPEIDVAAYKENGITRDIEMKNFDYSDRSKGVPCFYVHWTDSAGRARVSFGHTHYFRLPYVNSTVAAIPADRRRAEGETRWDVAQSLFGRVPKRGVDGARGRVAVEDGFWESEGGPSPAYSSSVEEIVLGQPKPTTYQHYLVQTKETLGDSISWDGNKDGRGPVVVRGFKMYWHRPGAALRTGEVRDNVASKIQPARATARFRSRIRFSNLREWELGAVVAALDLPPECAHRLGMGKPLGLGSFRITVTNVRLIQRKQRYASFWETANGTDGQLVTGSREEPNWKRFADAFAVEMGASNMAAYWNTPRLRELAAILRWKDLPEKWLEITRALQFGTVRLPEGERIYNEYQDVGYPKDRQSQKRRPLPKATQVLAAGAAIPQDGLPQFLIPRSRR